MPFQVFALTGGIGSGKSTVGRRFRARGLPVVDADELARAVVTKGRPALREIVAEFGSEMLTAEGELARAVLAERVFSQPLARERLEAITHPRIRELASSRFLGLKEQGEPLCCYEVPLLFEAGLDQIWRPVVVVSAPESVCLERAALRDGRTRQAISARLRAQMPLEEKERRADYLIDNSGALKETLAAADGVLDAIVRSFGLDPARYPLPD